MDLKHFTEEADQIAAGMQERTIEAEAAAKQRLIELEQNFKAKMEEQQVQLKAQDLKLKEMLMQSNTAMQQQEMDLKEKMHEKDTMVKVFDIASEREMEDKMVNESVEPTTAELEEAARQWRDNELAFTDWIIPLIDHPQREAHITYRESLRQWPSTDSFPETKPEL